MPLLKDYDVVNKPLEAYEKSGDERETLQYLKSKFEASKKARQGKVSRWRRNEELYNGDFLKPFKLPKYKSRVVANTIHSTLETIYSILTDREPKVDIMPKREDQIESAKTAQDVIESEMNKRKAYKAINMMKRDGLLYGNGFLKVSIQEGKANYTVPDPYTVFFDPLATNIQTANCVFFATPRYVDDVKKMFPKSKDDIQSEGSLNEYKSFIKQERDFGKSYDDQQYVTGQSPVEKSDIDEYGNGQVLLIEAWYKKDDKVYLATWTGNTLLQYGLAPYGFIPLVTFKNYQNAHSVWGKGEPEIIESLAVGTAILLSQGIDNIIYHGNPAIVMSKSLAKSPGNRPTDKPGQVFYLNNPSEQVNRLPAGNISASTLPMAQTLMQMQDTVSGVHDITQGRNPSGVTASRAIQQLQEASQQIIRAKDREVGNDAVIDIYKMSLSLFKNNYEEAIQVRKDTDAGYEFNDVNPYDLDDDLDFKYVPGSSMPESRASRIDQALDLVQMGLLQPDQFWMWTQRDLSQDIIKEIAQRNKAIQEEVARLQEIINTSEDKQEIEDAIIQLREMTGVGQQQQIQE